MDLFEGVPSSARVDHSDALVVILEHLVGGKFMSFLAEELDSCVPEKFRAALEAPVIDGCINLLSQVIVNFKDNLLHPKIRLNTKNKLKPTLIGAQKQLLASPSQSRLASIVR